MSEHLQRGTSGTPTRHEREDDAYRLRRAGYTRRAIWAKWVLDDFKVLYWHLTDDGKPLADDGKLDASFYLDADEWKEVAQAARKLADLADIITTMREFGQDE